MKIINIILKNKLTSLIIVISLIGVILLSISTVELVQISKNISPKQTTASTTESATETTESITESATESTTESTTVTTTKKPTTTTTTTKAPDPEITSKNVKEIFIPLIRHYTSLEQGWPFAIGIDYSHNYRNELMAVLCEQTDWTEMSVMGIYKFKTAKTVADVEKPYKKYLSESIVNQADLENSGSFFSYNGELYWIEGAKDTFEYDADSIEYRGKQDGGYVVAIDQFLGNGVYLSTETFLVQYLNGNFKIVQKLGEEMLHPNAYENPNYDSILNY